MDLLILLGHPNPRSYNAALARRLNAALAAAGYRVRFHDLYREGFNPVLGLSELHRRASFDDLVARHSADLLACGGLVIVHPDWWGLPPAILKGWADRVLTPGVAYAYEDGNSKPAPLLLGRRAFVVVTADGDEPGLSSGFWRLALGICGVAPVMVEEITGLGSPETDRLGAPDRIVAKVTSFFAG